MDAMSAQEVLVLLEMFCKIKNYLEETVQWLTHSQMLNYCRTFISQTSYHGLENAQRTNTATKKQLETMIQCAYIR